MAWDKSFLSAELETVAVEARHERVELVGVHLRMHGDINLGRFHRLSDLVNHSRGYIRVENAQLLRRNGEPTRLTLAELMVDQDEVSFIAQTAATAPGLPAAGDVTEQRVEKAARRLVVFTPGHSLTGNVHVFGEMTLGGFVDSTDPRFVPFTEVTTRSLADRRIISHYDLVLVNRTQMIAVAEVGRGASDSA